jgi:hypothetical protein
VTEKKDYQAPTLEKREQLAEVTEQQVAAFSGAGAAGPN